MIGTFDKRKIVLTKGEVFTNRTLKYIAPALKLYGEEFVTKYKPLAPLALGVGHGSIDYENIYTLFDVNGRTKFGTYIDKKDARYVFTHILQYFKSLPFYVKDYPFDSGLYGNQHMVVFKCPVSIKNFIEGKYSKIYTKDQLHVVPETITVDKKQIPNIVRQILTKDNQYKQEFLDKLNEEFNTSLRLKDIDESREFDIPPVLQNEIF